MSETNKEIVASLNTEESPSAVLSKMKYLVIALFIFVLGYTVFEMMKFEDSIRETRIVKVGSIKEQKLIPDISQAELHKRAEESAVRFRTGEKYFSIEEVKIRDGENVFEWHPHFLKGVNLGVAIPGNYPSEFSATYEMYLEWFRQIAAMNANTIRVYTILPPEFYEAFGQYNIDNNSKPLYLLQGVWADDADSNGYFSKEYSERFKHEIKDVIDVIHGNTIIKERPGHASGIYVRNVSQYVIGILLGREWEPNTVIATNNKNKDITRFSGDFISLPDGTPMEAWLAEMMDFCVRVETQLYKVQRPVSFVNWLPLDPMFHNSEFIESRKVREYDNDIESIDFRKFYRTPLFKAGIYSAYHAYPYYPDYVYMDDKYKNGVNPKGEKDNYFAYLEELKDKCPGMPLVIAEYGLPSSRGNSHSSPFGFDQGGHSERDQAELNKTLTEDIFNSGCGGAIYFEWIDEWFKFNWLVMDFEVPAERRKLWHNMENPEQNFGIIAVEQRTKTVDGKSDDWTVDEKISSSKGKVIISASSDAEYFYMKLDAVKLEPGKEEIFIAIDTYDKKKGSHKLPYIQDDLEHGYEFLISIRSKDSAQILVDEHYSVYSDIYADFVPVYASKENHDGKFVRQILLSNRERESLTGDKIDRKVYDRSSLIYGNSSLPEFSNSNLFMDDQNGTIEIRLPWHLVNVTDPSSRQVLNDIEGTPDIESIETKEFNILTYIVKDNGKSLVMNSDGENDRFTWKGWDKPEYRMREKESYKMFRDLFAGMKVKEDTVETASDNSYKIADWYNNKDGAITLSFDDGTVTQFALGVPVLDKYKMKATFALISEWTKENMSSSAEKGSFSVEKIGWNQARTLVADGHEIASHGFMHVKMDTMSTALATEHIVESKKSIEQNLDSKVYTFVFPYSATRDELFSAASDAGYLFARTGEETINDKGNLNLHKLSTIAIYNEYTPSTYELYSKFMASYGKWLILNYHNVFPEDSKEMNVLKSHNVYSTYSVTPAMFDKQVRLVRNADRWVAPISTVGRYVMQLDAAKLEVSEHDSKVFLKVVCNMDDPEFVVPMTIVVNTSWKFVRVEGSTNDGIFNPVNGKILINTLPNKEVVIEELKEIR